MHDFQYCFICRPSDSTVSEDAGSNPGQLRLRHWLSDALTTWLDLIHIRLDLIHFFYNCSFWFLERFFDTHKIQECRFILEGSVPQFGECFFINPCPLWPWFSLLYCCLSPSYYRIFLVHRCQRHPWTFWTRRTRLLTMPNYQQCWV